VIGIQLLALQLESGILNSTESDLENTVKSEKATPKRISALEVEKLLENGRVTIADIRDKKSYLTSNIPDSIHLSQDNLEEFMKNTNAEEPLLIYCYHGINSINTAEYFVNQGFKNVYSLDGGYSEYSKKSKSRP
tara:strand:+ start:79 stop:483 length:405 start_codon:yes stop_codon:yes gene_type:complete